MITDIEKELLNKLVRNKKKQTIYEVKSIGICADNNDKTYPNIFMVHYIDEEGNNFYRHYTEFIKKFDIL